MVGESQLRCSSIERRGTNRAAVGDRARVAPPL